MAVQSLAEAVQWVVDALKGAGVTATVEAADADLPGVIVYPSLVDFDRLEADAYEMTVDLLLVASQLRALDALDQLEDLLAKVRLVFPVTEARAIMVQLSSQSADQLPAFQCSILLSATPDA